MTFCASLGCKNKCGRKLTTQVLNAADKWWGKKGAPISMAEFCDDNGELK